ncbi:zinc finger MYND domain-containing protein [Phanerochaete sordida]|uniref:Zinc finger MYND domain-containing protein n=1 Tax=Phanerochaete sordida TaxID=48140 RepID=A0A9P3LKL4_9APHY|nr:zinc finger MYND domain-containing protein [Phanerochaete sordida]
MASQPRQGATARAEIERFADDMAKELRLLDSPLPKDVDFNDEEMDTIQSRLNAMWHPNLPSSFTDPLYIAFSAKYLPALAASLRALSLDTQRNAFSTLVQVLSLLPAERDPYARRFFASQQFAGVPTLLARAFVRGIAWLRPSGAGALCDLFYHMLIWGDPAGGDDAQTCIDKDARVALASTVKEIPTSEGFARLDEKQRRQVKQLAVALMMLNGEGGVRVVADNWIQAQRGLHESSVRGILECAVCLEDEELFFCSKCKTVKYCSKECQLKAWKGKEGHKFQCYDTAY